MKLIIERKFERNKVENVEMISFVKTKNGIQVKLIIIYFMLNLFKVKIFFKCEKISI